MSSLKLLDLLANVRIRDHGKGCLKLRKRLGFLAGIGQQLCFAAQACELLDFSNGSAPKTGDGARRFRSKQVGIVGELVQNVLGFYVALLLENRLLSFLKSAPAAQAATA